MNVHVKNVVIKPTVMERTTYPLVHGAPRMYPKPAVETPDGFSGAIEAETIGSRTLLPIVPVSIKTIGKSVVLFALLDQGSQVSVMMTATASKLGLEGPVRRVTTKTVEGKTKQVNRMIEKFDISSIDGSYSFNIGLFYIAKIRFPEIWQRMRFVGVFRLHGKGQKKSKSLQ